MSKDFFHLYTCLASFVKKKSHLFTLVTFLGCIAIIHLYIKLCRPWCLIWFNTVCQCPFLETVEKRFLEKCPKNFLIYLPVSYLLRLYSDNWLVYQLCILYTVCPDSEGTLWLAPAEPLTYPVVPTLRDYKLSWLKTKF